MEDQILGSNVFKLCTAIFKYLEFQYPGISKVGIPLYMMIMGDIAVHMFINVNKQKINIAMHMYMHDDIRFRT